MKLLNINYIIFIHKKIDFDFNTFIFYSVMHRQYFSHQYPIINSTMPHTAPLESQEYPH